MLYQIIVTVCEMMILIEMDKVYLTCQQPLALRSWKELPHTLSLQTRVHAQDQKFFLKL